MSDTARSSAVATVLVDGTLGEVEGALAQVDGVVLELAMGRLPDAALNSFSPQRVALVAGMLGRGERREWAGRLLRAGNRGGEGEVAARLAAGSQNDAGTVSLILEGSVELGGVAGFAQLLADGQEQERARRLGRALARGVGRRMPPAGLVHLAGVAGAGVFLDTLDAAGLGLAGEESEEVVAVAVRAAGLWREDRELFDLAAMICPFDGTLEQLLEVAAALR